MSSSPSASPPCARSKNERYDDRVIGLVVGRGVDAGATVQGVLSATTLEHVVAAAAIELVVAAAALEVVGSIATLQDVEVVVADQEVLMGRTHEVFDAYEMVAFGGAACPIAAEEADGDARRWSCRKPPCRCRRLRR